MTDPFESLPMTRAFMSKIGEIRSDADQPTSAADLEVALEVITAAMGTIVEAAGAAIATLESRLNDLTKTAAR